MKINYDITEGQYAEVVEYQMRLRNNQPIKKLKFWLSNILFSGFAIYFCILRTEYNWLIRIMPIVMALILLGLSLYPRLMIKKRAEAAVKQYKSNGTLQKGYIGLHTLNIENGIVKRHFANAWTEINCNEVVHLQELRLSTILIAHNVIFEMIPNEVLDKENNREQLESALLNGRDEVELEIKQKIDMQLLEEHVKIKLSWKVKKPVYIKGQVLGHRWFYLTRQAWNSNQIIRTIILLYGIGQLVSGTNIYIGLSFTIVGLLISRQMVISMTPLSYVIVKQQMEKILGVKENIGEEEFYVTQNELMAVYMGEIQKVKLKEISKIRKTEEFIFIYTNDLDMVVVPHQVFQSKKEKDIFLRLVIPSPLDK